ncbi:MAG: hypothetical protein WA400_05420 [Silvibacterium sp.]
MDRRDFIKSGALIAASGLLHTPQGLVQALRPHRIAIKTQAASSQTVRLATLELVTGLRSLNNAPEITKSSSESAAGSAVLILSIDRSSFKSDQEYEIAACKAGAILKGASGQALLYAVFDFLERQGMVFGIDGTTVPIDRSPLMLPTASQPWTESPRFAVRGLLPWPDFLNCISVYNLEDYKAYFAAMLRMRFNMFGVHVYTQNDPGPLAESYLSFDFAGTGHRAALEDSTMRSWGYLPQRTSSYKMGAAQFFDQETFGADATRLEADIWKIAGRTTEMMRAAFNFASDLGIRTGIGFEPYQNPVEIVRALPPEALSCPGGFIESRTAKALLERRLADLLERYPMVDDVWLWQDENANWESRIKKIPLSVTPFQQAHDFLKRHAPEKRLVLAGWGGVTHHFESLHQRLPEDIVFSALNDSVGWDPVNEAFSKLGNRERWPIPWLEDDPSMWFPQFRASRVQVDMKRAQDFGCQGVLGIHWRHRIIDPTATYFARAGWSEQLTAAARYRNFCAAMASQGRASRLADLFSDCDSGQAISSTFSGTDNKEGYANRIEITGDYDEAFNYAASEPDLAVLPIQRATAKAFQELQAEATTPLEKNRIGYFAGFVALMVPYCDAYETAHKLNAVLEEAVRLRTAGSEAQARTHVMQNGVPLWLSIAPLARRVMLDYQGVIATRNDQGQLASMQNKFVRIAIERLRLSIQEFMDELPPEMNQAYEAAISPEQANPARIFIPTRPSLMKLGESLRIFIVAPGVEEAEVKFHTRCQGQSEWKMRLAAHAGRSVYSVNLGPFPAQDEMVEYYASVTPSGRTESFLDPPEAPRNTYKMNMIV